MNIDDFENVYHQYQPKVKRLVLGYVKGDKDVANDLVQEVFVKVWQKREDFRQEADIGTWIYRITINCCLMFLRSKKSLSLEAETQPAEESKNHLEQERKFQKMYSCIAKLSELERNIILLELEDIPQAKIAEIIGKSHKAVRTQIYRIKLKLSECVSKDE